MVPEIVPSATSPVLLYYRLKITCTSFQFFLRHLTKNEVSWETFLFLQHLTKNEPGDDDDVNENDDDNVDGR